MLLPLMFLAVSFTTYLILGWIVLGFVPSLRLTLLNLFLFLVGAYAGMIGAVLLYGRIFSTDNAVTVPAADRRISILLAFLMVGGAAGGAFVVWLKMRLMQRSSDEFPKSFSVQRITSIDAKALSNLPASEIARFFRENPYAAGKLLGESLDKRFTPSTFIVEDRHGLFRVGWFTRAAKYEYVREFDNLADAATDYLLFSLGKSRWKSRQNASPPE